MAKQQWNLISFDSHIDPQKQEQLKRLKLAADDQVERILKITSDINHGNKERNLRKKSEAIDLIQDFHNQYEKLYILYENLREKVKKSVDAQSEELNDGNNELADDDSLAKIKYLEEQIQTLKAEVSTLCMDKKRLEEEVEWKSNEAVETQDKMSALQAQIAEMEAASNEQEHLFTSRISDLEAHTQQMHLHFDSLKREKDELEGQFSSQLEKKSEEISEYLLQIEALRNEPSLSERESLHDLESEVESLRKTKNELEEQVKKMTDESSAEKEKLQEEICELKIAIDKEKEQSSINKSHLEKVTRTNLHNVERRIEEMAADFRKQFEDQYRLLSRRIRVAEQLQAENKEWYRKMRDGYEQGNKEMTARNATELKNVKDLSLAANALLKAMDSNAIKFEDCTSRFMKRISKASGEINLAKHNWAMKKNKALSDMKHDLDCLAAQIDGKESELLACREKASELENKVGELKKNIEEKDEEMVVITEEKREAIRQLCVGIDYHRDRSDSYRKMVSHMNSARRTAF